MADPVPWSWPLGGEPAEEVEALTDVMTAVHGAEQRRGLRQTPRLYLRFDGLAEGDDRRHLEQAIAVNGAGQWVVPYKFDGLQLQAGLPAGAASIPVDPLHRHFTAGGRVMLLGEGSRQVEVATIAEVLADSVGLDGVLASDWPAGAMVYPAELCSLAEQPRLQRFTGDSASYSVRFRSDAPVAWSAAHGLPLYRGLPVLELPPDWGAGDPSDQPVRLLSYSDDDVARPNTFDLARIPLPRMTRNLAAWDIAGLSQLRALLAYLDGRRCPLWVPTLADDLVIAQPVAGGASQIHVRWTGLAAQALQEGRRDIRIALASGQVLYRRITAAAAVSGTAERITVDSPIVSGFAPAAVGQVSFMVPARSDADIGLIRHWAHGIGMLQMTFKGLRDGL